MPFRLTVSAALGATEAGAIRLRLASAEGVVADFDLPVSLALLAPRLVVTPAELVTGMRRGSQASVEFGVTNLGGVASGPISVLTPPLPWLHVAAGQGLALAPGEGGVVSLLLTPPADLALAEHTGTLVVSAAGTGVSVPFRFRALSDSTGALRVSVVDEFTYYAEGSPPVTNAMVRLTLRATCWCRR
jgi:hypothetical protein